MSHEASQINRSNLQKAADFKNSIQETQEASATLDAALTANRIEATQEKLQDEAEGNAAFIIKLSKKLEVVKKVKTEKAKKAQGSVLVRKDEADGLAGSFSQRQGNREYRLDPALLSQLLAEELGMGIRENSTPAEIIALIRQRMTVKGETPDVAIVDKAFEFLLEATQIQLNKSSGADKIRLGNIFKKLELSKNKHYDAHAIEIQVAQKIIGAVDAVVQKTGQTVKETLDHYRDVVHNPPDIQALRKFYEAKGYKAMVLELKGLSTYLGGNFKRTNLDSPELIQLAVAARKMQALLQVFRQSKILQGTTMLSYLKSHNVIAA